MRFSLLSTLLLAALTLTACDASDPSSPGDTVEAQLVANLAADPNTGLDPITGRPTGATGRYTLYSLRENRVIPNADSATTRWDVGFQASTIIANGAGRGPGQGGLLLRVGAFGEMNVAPDTVYAGAVIGSQWYDYANNAVTPKAGRTIFVRTADGRYGKMRILSYYKDREEGSTDPTASRYYTFEYVLQTDGSRMFE